MDQRKALQYLLSQLSYLRLGGQICDEQVHPPATGGTDLASRVLSTPAVSTDDREACSHLGQAQRGRPADASAATGDQHCPTGHRPCSMFVLLRRLDAEVASAVSTSLIGGPRH